MSKQLAVDESFIKEAYEAACSEWKERIKGKFPNLFKREEFVFAEYCSPSSTYELSTRFGGPLAIGKDLVDDELKGKCLVLNFNYDMEIKLLPNGQRALVFFKR